MIYRIVRSDDGVLFCPFNDFGDVAEGETRDGVGAAVVDGDAARFGIVERGAGEGHVGHVAGQLINFARRNQVGSRAGNHFPGLFEIQQCGAECIDVAVA